MYVSDEDEGEYEPLLPYTQSTAQIFLNAINPVDCRTWRRQHWSAKVLKVIKVENMWIHLHDHFLVLNE